MESFRSITLKRNIIPIFIGPTTFTFDSKPVKLRNKLTEMRYEALGSQHTYVTPSGAMPWRFSPDSTVGFLIEDL